MAPPAGCSGRIVRFQLAAPTQLLNSTLRLHWRAKTKKNRALAWEVRLAIGSQIPAEPFSKAWVRIERHSVGIPDYDGMVGGLKSLIDCLLPQSKIHPTGLGLIIDDNQRAMTLESVSVKALRRADQKTVITIWELNNDLDPSG